MRRHDGNNCPLDQPISFHIAQAQRQHPLRYSIDCTLYFSESAWPVRQEHNDQDTPLLTNARQYLTDLLAVGMS
ncbi:hypothetical protein SMDB11_3535 [Serratia marcescens subsp. marcescens Db11]|uniref:Uncharacterized protein n=1 Tax=Serratia marcescens subsp. marcescens Db11 TaxID=273526 RepID=A0ABC9IN27_SERMA|nr:hypothetical protein SMDB11_3535 [Serratia marcescens subsp. marcescens Db11]